MYTMMQVCREADMTYQALKFYCNEGLVPNVKRDKNNRRIFSEHDLQWIKSLSCLKRCGMGIQEMKEYLVLCLEGKATIPQRQKVLAAKREALVAEIRELEECVDYVDWKQEYYEQVLAGQRPYESNLIREEERSAGTLKSERSSHGSGAGPGSQQAAKDRNEVMGLCVSEPKQVVRQAKIPPFSFGKWG